MKRGLLWICIALFFLRVVGQIEVLLVATDWLPPMPAWYSGLLPYPVLLPVQIAILMGMCAVAVRDARAGSRAVRVLAMLYFTGMALRLGWIVHLHGGEYYQHGAIPVAFHWVLALFAMSAASER